MGLVHLPHAVRGDVHIYDPAWKTGAAFFVSMGAFLFCLSDVILAWNKFVSPDQKWTRTEYRRSIISGQIGLIAGVISQFG